MTSRERMHFDGVHISPVGAANRAEAQRAAEDAAFRAWVWMVIACVLVPLVVVGVALNLGWL